MKQKLKKKLFLDTPKETLGAKVRKKIQKKFETEIKNREDKRKTKEREEMKYEVLEEVKELDIVQQELKPKTGKEEEQNGGRKEVKQDRDSKLAFIFNYNRGGEPYAGELARTVREEAIVCKGGGRLSFIEPVNFVDEFFLKRISWTTRENVLISKK